MDEPRPGTLHNKLGDQDVERGRRGDMIKLLWFDGDGLYLFAKRLERGRFIWPRAKDGVVLAPGRSTRFFRTATAAYRENLAFGSVT